MLLEFIYGVKVGRLLRVEYLRREEQGACLLRPLQQEG
jgi:hypothetical protein